MIRQAIFIAVWVPCVLLMACQGLDRDDSTSLVVNATNARNQGYALLYATIDSESNIDKLLMIKNPSPQVVELVKAIAQFARVAKERLQAFAKEDPSLRLDHPGLPEVEKHTREVISSVTGKQLVFSGGKEFEFRILLTQHDALNYITHLAGELSKQDERESRKQYLTQLALESKVMHERVLAQLKTPYVGQAK